MKIELDTAVAGNNTEPRAVFNDRPYRNHHMVL